MLQLAKMSRARSQLVPGSPARASSRPGPPALTLEAPPSRSGPTVNWKGLPGTCTPLYFTLTQCTPISVGTKRTQYVSPPTLTTSAGWWAPEGAVTSATTFSVSTPRNTMRHDLELRPNQTREQGGLFLRQREQRDRLLFILQLV